MKKTLIILGAVILIGVGAAAYFNNHSEGSLATDQDQAKSFVENFGERLNMVSLLAPNAGEVIKDQYGDFLSPELLAAWLSDPKQAPGRLTSSPYPAGIEVESVTQNEDGTYSVSGHIVFMTSTEEASVEDDNAGTWPVVIVVQKKEAENALKNLTDHWQIISYIEQGQGNVSGNTDQNNGTETPVGNNPSSGTVSLDGKVVCLTYKGDGPHTMECAYGLKSNGKDYALKNLNSVVTSIIGQANIDVRVTGTLSKPSADEKYDIVGVVDVKSVDEI